MGKRIRLVSSMKTTRFVGGGLGYVNKQLEVNATEPDQLHSATADSPA